MQEEEKLKYIGDKMTDHWNITETPGVLQEGRFSEHLMGSFYF